MATVQFLSSLEKEIARIDEAKTTKRKERVIERFTDTSSKKAIINNKEYYLFNSNDYLSLRFHPEVKEAEHKGSQQYGAGPGAVRFISGTLKIHKDLEKTTANFHKRDDAMIFSSAFAANLAVMYCLSQGLTKDSLIDSNVLIVSDALNHRSIIDGVRLTGLPKEQRVIFEHMNPESLKQILEDHLGKIKRVIVVTDGVFSMLGEFQKLKAIKTVINLYEKKYEQGILLVVDDAHGVGIAGKTGRGIEEVEGVQADVLIGTYGKAFGTDGGYVVSNQTIIDYLRESSATYIYSNSIAPATAAAAQRSVQLLDEPAGKILLKQSRINTEYFKKQLPKTNFSFAADSNHPIQPVLIGDTARTKALVEYLFKHNIIATNISYPVVPKGRDEIRIQISATHTEKDINYLIQILKSYK